MGLQSAMTTALTGLQAAETTIDVVGNNVANSNTVGFKESNVLFATQFLQTQSIGSAPTTASGGTNPRQIGLGVKVAEIAPEFTQGTIEVSSNPLDLAIQGDGFFIVAGPSGAGQRYYTRNGQFKTNAENELVSITGDRVLGYGVNDQFVVNTNNVVPITIPLGGSAVAQATSNVNLTGNLPPSNAGLSTQAGIIESAVLSLNGNAVEIPDDLATGDVVDVDPAILSPSVSAAANGGGTGSVPAGTYSYRITFVDTTPGITPGNEEGPATNVFGTVTTAANDSVTLDDLPVSPDPSVYTMKRIYRADASGVYQLVAERPEAETTYVDTAAAGTTELNTDNLNEGGDYSYFVTFWGPGRESRPTSESTTITVTTPNRRIRLDNLPQPTSAEFTNVRIYRNVANNPDTFYLVEQLPIGQTSYIDHTPDEQIAFDGNAVLDRNGPPIFNNTPLLNVSRFDGSGYVDLFKEGTLQFTGSKGTEGGLDLATKELTIDATTTVLDLLNFMEDSLGILETSPSPTHPLTNTPGATLVDSRITVESNIGVHNEVSVHPQAFRLIGADGSQQTIPLNFSSIQDADGAGTSSEMIVYDSLGIPLNVRLTTALESIQPGVTTFRWFATSPDNQQATGVDTQVGTGLIRFDGDGNFISATSETVTIERREVASTSPVEFDLDFSQVTSVDQQTENRLQLSTQDGFAAGTLASFSITESGRIKGVYSNGVTRDLGQLLMARFSNPGGLQQIGDNLWAEGVNSGEALTGLPGEQGIGSLTAGAVELSNTDIGQNLIDLILASTQYRGGARVITSAQQLLDELLSLRR